MSDLLPPLRRLAAVHDLSGLGKCSLTVALPVVSATGVECACIPTAVLSTHTGEFTGWTLRDLHEDMVPVARHWATTGAVFDGIYSGYLATPEQTEALREIIRLLRRPGAHVIVDPVMADNGSYYSNLDDRMCRAFRALLSDADVITPNVTEAALLADLEYRHEGHDEAYLRRLCEKLAALGAKTVVITGVRPEKGKIGNLAYDAGTDHLRVCVHDAHPGLFYGTGDIFASSLAALLVRGAGLDDALRVASDFTDACICRSLRHDTPRHFGVDFEGALPDYSRAVEALFPLT